MVLDDLRSRITTLLTRKPYGRYAALPENVSQDEVDRRTRVWAGRHKTAIKLTLTAMIFAAVGFFIVNYSRTTRGSSCDGVRNGFHCETDISHSWGQYSPFYSVPSDISAHLPANCTVTFAQMLSRHGARDPTAGKTVLYGGVLEHIHSSVSEYGKRYEFIKDYDYTLGADQLTLFGEQQMVNSGTKFYRRYEQLAKTASPFVRAAAQERVVESARNWTQGFHEARLADKRAKSPDGYPYDILAIPEERGSNNSLSPSGCNAFEEAKDLGKEAQDIWLEIFMPAIAERVNQNLPGANLSNLQIIYFMDLCPFETVAGDKGYLSLFCRLFTTDEWHSYDYYQSLGKWYGYGTGNPLGPTQGVGFVNELIARLTGKPVVDATSTNSTLDGSDATFPLDNKLYADFSHDNDMTGVFAALGLYNETTPLSNITEESPKETRGYSASWTVPFAARMYVEKMTCEGSDEELVRILVNDRVIPLQNCGGDELGRCTMDMFVESLSFARSGGHWDMCFA